MDDRGVNKFCKNGEKKKQYNSSNNVAVELQECSLIIYLFSF